MRARTDAAAVIFLRLVFEDANFLAQLVAHGGGADINALDDGGRRILVSSPSTTINTSTFSNRTARLDVETIHQNLGAVLDAILFAANADNCEHDFLLSSFDLLWKMPEPFYYKQPRASNEGGERRKDKGRKGCVPRTSALFVSLYPSSFILYPFLRASFALTSFDAMQQIETSIPGVFLLAPQIFGDARGFFMQTYSAREFRRNGR